MTSFKLNKDAWVVFHIYIYVCVGVCVCVYEPKLTLSGSVHQLTKRPIKCLVLPLSTPKGFAAIIVCRGNLFLPRHILGNICMTI